MIIPDIIAQEIVDDLEAALEQFRLIANDLGSDTSEKVTFRLQQMYPFSLGRWFL